MLDTIISLMLDLFITVIAYLFIPTIFCIVEHNKRHSYNLKTIKKITIINGACIWFVLQIIRFYSGETEVSISGVLLWSFVAYWMMKKILLEKDIELKSDETENDEKIEFEIVNKKEKNRSFKIPLIVVSILLVLSVALNLYQLGLNNQRDEERIENRDKLNFLDEYVVFIEDDSTNWYHKYECYRFKGRDFWAYNIDQAENLGYEPCPNCCK